MRRLSGLRVYLASRRAGVKLGVKIFLALLVLASIYAVTLHSLIVWMAIVRDGKAPADQGDFASWAPCIFAGTMMAAFTVLVLVVCEEEIRKWFSKRGRVVLKHQRAQRKQLAQIQKIKAADQRAASLIAADERFVEQVERYAGLHGVNVLEAALLAREAQDLIKAKAKNSKR